ncbi:MAG: extracellular solute-binding protein [Opitutaceae bacterium]|nr:extracellular solute-binding protein [Opitutaceae bacterium]
MKTLREKLTRYLSPGALIILFLAVVSVLTTLLLPRKQAEGIPFWVSAQAHYQAYKPFVAEWNARHPDRKINLIQLHATALERRMLSGFLAGTPVADLIEPNSTTAAKGFAGPLSSVGYYDLTDHIKAEGLLERINPPSFALFTTRHRIFGLPHDVHPVLLAYRSDLVEAAGIDVSTIETWDDYFRVMSPLMRDRDGDGRPDRYLLEAWDSNAIAISILLLQADGKLLDAQDRPALNDPRNAHILARLVTWFSGPKRVCIDINQDSAIGHRQRLDGQVIGCLLPDWRAGQWKRENPGLAGKLKLMPLPAWEKGGRRTSGFGGTMLGINRHTQHFDTCWEFAKELYFSPRLAEQLFRDTNIITPVKALWSSPIFDRPDPYFNGQASGRLYIDQAPHVPLRSSSPYYANAVANIANAVSELKAHADRTRTFDEAALTRVAQAILDRAQYAMEREVSRNLFLLQEP